MIKRKKTKLASVVFFTFSIGFGQAVALDINSQQNTSQPQADLSQPQTGQPQTEINVQFRFFKSGISAYKKGDKEKAIEALRFAADMGHQAACWKLGRMYAEGDGVSKNDYEAYKYFVKVVKDGAEPGAENETYVSDALVEIAHYLRTGIPNSPINVDMVRARRLYAQAAISYGNPEAQYYLGKMLYNGEGGDKNIVQAARWFQLAAKKGNANAQAMFGNMLFQAGKTVHGLAMMTAAYEKASPKDQVWIRPMQEKAFAIAQEADRRTAVSLANEILINPSDY